MSWTGRRLQARSQWKVFGYAEYTDNKTQKKSCLDNLGGNQWIFDEYLLNVSAPDHNADNQQPGAAALPANSYVVISYVPNYGVAMFRQNGNAMHFAGRYLRNGSVWNAFSKLNLNNSLYKTLVATNGLALTLRF